MNKKEFANLHPGRIIRNKKNTELAFIISAVFQDRVTAVRTIEIRDPKDWEIVETIHDNKE